MQTTGLSAIFFTLRNVKDSACMHPQNGAIQKSYMETCARALIFHWITCFGIYLDITSDCSPHSHQNNVFISQESFQEWAKVHLKRLLFHISTPQICRTSENASFQYKSFHTQLVWGGGPVATHNEFLSLLLEAITSFALV